LSALCRVRTARGAAEAVQQIVTTPPDLMILDDTPVPADAGRLPDMIAACAPELPVIVHASAPAGSLAALAGLAVCGFCPAPAVRELVVLAAAVLDLEPPAGGAAAQHVSAALAFIARQPGRKLRVSEVAAAIGLSTTYFAKVFRDDTGMPAKDYLTRVHLEVAKRFLLETDATLEVVAARAGFCDSSHLVRTFHRHIGCTPGAFRRATSVVPLRLVAGAP
jgi:AraC-like DNA-binding protein